VSVIVYSDIYPFLEQISSELYFCIGMYFLEIIGSEPIEFFLEYGP
jgi:hypothetical protein